MDMRLLELECTPTKADEDSSTVELSASVEHDGIPYVLDVKGDIYLKYEHCPGDRDTAPASELVYTKVYIDSFYLHDMEANILNMFKDTTITSKDIEDLLESYCIE